MGRRKRGAEEGQEKFEDSMTVLTRPSLGIVKPRGDENGRRKKEGEEGRKGGFASMKSLKPRKEKEGTKEKKKKAMVAKA